MKGNECTEGGKSEAKGNQENGGIYYEEGQVVNPSRQTCLTDMVVSIKRTIEPSVFCMV